MTDVAIISEEINENSQNTNNIRCQFCNSLILCKESGKFTKSDVISILLKLKSDNNLTCISYFSSVYR